MKSGRKSQTKAARPVTLARTLGCLAAIALLAGCNTTSKLASAGAIDDIRRAIGTELPGTRGATPRDQDAIDDTIAGACKVGIYKPQECRRHNEVAR